MCEAREDARKCREYDYGTVQQRVSLKNQLYFCSQPSAGQSGTWASHVSNLLNIRIIPLFKLYSSCLRIAIDDQCEQQKGKKRPPWESNPRPLAQKASALPSELGGPATCLLVYLNLYSVLIFHLYDAQSILCLNNIQTTPGRIDIQRGRQCEIITEKDGSFNSCVCFVTSLCLGMDQTYSYLQVLRRSLESAVRRTVRKRNSITTVLSIRKETVTSTRIRLNAIIDASLCSATMSTRFLAKIMQLYQPLQEYIFCNFIASDQYLLIQC
eukprot:TRINITY_DN1326_c0_g1_i5.p1 TRINITY_DN1326_c0_g1~~TRINITY_DN1326_c0_g1_i5.p1  ORF type:complete len:269 (+),score=-62.67 TRINITY_DN1326_c0_g1_i5:741-1547(+)